MEKDIEFWLGEKIRALKGLWLKFSSPGTIGVPDRILILKGHVSFVELKTASGKLSAIQIAQHQRFVRTGVSVHVIYGMAGAREFLSEMTKNDWVLSSDIPDVYTWWGK